MVNLKEELQRYLGCLGEKTNIKCAYITYDFDFEEAEEDEEFEKQRIYELSIKHNKIDLEIFLNSLDFEYDNNCEDWEVPHIYGYVWLTDGTWLSRVEFDEKECWTRKRYPKIPAHLE